MGHEQFEKKPYLLNAGPLGWIEGVTLHNTTSSQQATSHHFGGIPYALPPTGRYRFRQARPLPEGYRYGTKANPGRYSQKTAVCPQPAWRGRQDQTLWDEDCLQLNIHVPAGRPPSKGWPVFIYIHGGYLQWGSANYEQTAVAPLLSETAFRSIIVIPAYRLNALGFLASRELQTEAQQLGEPVGNQGFWDQRLALEFVSQNIGFFGGDKHNITLGGYSAGAHATYQQLAHELYFVAEDKAIIKRVIMWSNSPGVQPKALFEQQKQFDELLTALDIPLAITAEEKLSRLRAVSPETLQSAQDGLKLSEFRALSDGVFIAKDIIARINSGDFGRRMKARGIKIMNGECRDEHFIYRAWRTPRPSYDAVFTRLCADYPEVTVKKLVQHYCGDARTLPQGMQNWQEAFGKLYANMQVHCLERGFLAALVKGGLRPGKDIFRYRFNWRAQCLDKNYPLEWGVTHGTDIAIWFWGLDYGNGLTEQEKKVLKSWNEAFAAFVNGDDVNWKLSKIQDMARLTESGETDVWTDDRWEEGLKVWEVVNGQTGSGVLGWMRSKL